MGLAVRIMTVGPVVSLVLLVVLILLQGPY